MKVMMMSERDFEKSLDFENVTGAVEELPAPYVLNWKKALNKTREADGPLA
jgi:hypothetical protein